MSEHELHVLVARFAWTLIHFLWQGVAIALVLQLVLSGLRRRAASTRYLVRCAALGGLALAPIVTFVSLGGGTVESADPSLLALVAAAEAPTGTWGSWLASGDLLPWVVVLWSVGASFCSARLAGGCWQVRRLRRRVFGVDLTPTWQRRFERLARELGVRARARVVESASVAVPAVIGCVKPVVLLPARLFTGLTEEQIEEAMRLVPDDVVQMITASGTPDEVARYEPWQRKRLSVQPGITGMWQVNGRSDVPFEEMVLLDIFYIENWSLALDIKILLRTLRAAVASHEGNHG